MAPIVTSDWFIAVGNTNVSGAAAQSLLVRNERHMNIAMDRMFNVQRINGARDDSTNHFTKNWEPHELGCGIRVLGLHCLENMLNSEMESPLSLTAKPRT